MRTFLWSSPEILDSGFQHHDLVKQLSRCLGVSAQKPGSPEIGIHVFFVLASWLFQNSDWYRSLSGIKIVVEHDAYLNFLYESPYYNSWTNFYKYHHFDLIIASGKITTERLLNDGLPAQWVPKGTNSEFLDYPNKRTGNIGYFAIPLAEQETGEQFYFYRSRHKINQLISHLTPIACQFRDFPSVVSLFSAAVTNDETMHEPMAKHFECSALGCVMIRDAQPELIDLGYRDGESMIVYRNISDLLEKIDFYGKNTELLIPMQENARLISKKHTWSHRAESIADVVRRFRRIF